MNDNKVLIEFSHESDIKDWRVTSDRVMGGLSKGNIDINNQSLLFTGALSTENNGGFTSIFKELPKLSKDIDTINIRVTGDGNYYQLRLRSQFNGRDIAYKAGFNTEQGEIINHTFNLSDFVATLRGRIINNAPKIEASLISEIGFLIKSKHEQEFMLKIHHLKMY
jgi:hypothetical protein